VLAVVLNDEETYSVLEGCSVVEVAEDYLEEHDSYDNDGRVVAEFFSEAPYADLDEAEDTELLIVVLADGETFSPLGGCSVVELADNYNGVDPLADGTTLAEF
jgi:hypothetical protein